MTSNEGGQGMEANAEATTTLAEATPKGLEPREYARMVVCAAIATETPTPDLDDLLGRTSWPVPRLMPERGADGPADRGPEDRSHVRVAHIGTDREFKVVLKEAMWRGIFRFRDRSGREIRLSGTGAMLALLAYRDDGAEASASERGGAPTGTLRDEVVEQLVLIKAAQRLVNAKPGAVHYKAFGQLEDVKGFFWSVFRRAGCRLPEERELEERALTLLQRVGVGGPYEAGRTREERQ